MRHVVDGIADALLQIGMNYVEIGFERVDQGNVEAVLPDAGRAVAGDAMFVPGAVRRQHKIVGAERHLVAIDDGVGTLAFHDEAKRRCRMGVGGCDLARMHDLQAGIEPADRGGVVAAAGIVQIDDAAASLLRRHQFDGAQHMCAEVLIAPQHGN